MTGGLLVFADDEAGTAAARRRFGGLTVVERGIRTMARAGVRRLLIVLPAGIDVALGRALGRVTRQLDLDLEIARWRAPVHTPFAAGDEVLVLLGDCVHHHSSLAAFVAGGTAGADLVAQVTGPTGSIGGLHAVVLRGGSLAFTAAPPGAAAVSTGAFLVAGALHPEEMVGAGGSPLAFLAGRAGRGATRPGDPGLWVRVGDGPSARAAKEMLFRQVTKKTSGPVSRHLNARLSIPISKLLIETGISPHMVTVLFVLTTGLAAAWLIARPAPYWRLALAGLLWHLAAVLDRCDGEIARVKLCESRFGAWFDTVTDNIAYLAAYAAFLSAATHLHPDRPWLLYAGLSAVGAMLVSLGVMYNYALRTGSGSLQNYLVGFSRHVPQAEKGAVYRALERYAFLAKRDSFAFTYLLLALTGRFELVYAYTVGGLHLLAVGVLISQRKMLEGHRRHVAHGQPLPAVAAVPREEATP